MLSKVLCHYRDCGVHGKRCFISVRFLRTEWLRTLLFVLFMLYGTSVTAAEVILKEINISAREEDTKINIDLGTPLEYVKHFPQSFGEIIQIQLKLTTDRSREIHKEVRQGSELKTPAGTEPLLIYVTYEEGVPGGPYLTFRFVKPLRFRVEAQTSPTQLSITVFGEPKKEVKTPDVELVEGEKPQPAAPTQPEAPDADLGQLMAKARQALTFGDNESAIRLLRKIIAVSGNPHEQDARELLGLALERSGQIPRAKFEYKKYLELYKEGAGPVRVQQRLTALENIGAVERREKLRVPKRARKVEEYKLFGRWSQDYSLRLLEQNVDDPNEEEPTILGTVVTSERASTHASLRGRYRANDRIVQTVFIGSHNYDFQNSYYTQGRISDMYIDWDEIKLGLTGVLGRQRARSSGVYERYDGLDLGYTVVDGIKPHLLVGQNVSYYDVDYSKQFGAIRTELGKRKAKLTGNVFVVSQNVEGDTDRQALGGDFRYTAKIHSFSGNLDFDVFFNELNLLNLRWGWQLNAKSRLNFSYDFRKLVMLTNALFGLQVSEQGFGPNPINRALRYDEFAQIFSEERAKELAINRTSESTSITVGNTYQISKQKQLNTDLSIYKTAPYESFEFTEEEQDKYLEVTDSVNKLPNHAEYEGTTSYNLTTQFILNDVFAPQDLHIVGFRFNKFSDTFDDYVLFYNGRLSPWFNWNPRPRINLGYRNSRGGTNVVQADRTQISPSIKVDRRWKKSWVFEFELGFDGFFYEKVENAPEDQTGYFFRVGYHYTF
ncbi:MAG: hypothetical protein AMJ53_11850 [Gammaproteobacteria bacterium SG8_11]|nr:MAG: hypothetical protein AMJ53_11850 [Gammaproteobacteria bacterium SG8_11]